MQKSLLAAAIAAASLGLAAPALAQQGPMAFPALTTIYVASGVFDDGGADNLGVATVIQCSNVSGGNVDIRVVVLSFGSVVEGDITSEDVPHTSTPIFSTHGTVPFFEADLGTGPVTGGVLNIEATNAAVFCQAQVMPAAGPVTTAVPLRLVRVNPQPGTQE